MKKHYFDPLKFDDEEPEVKPKPRKTFPAKDDFKKAITIITREVSRIQAGKSEYHPYAIQLKDGRCPATVSLNRFKDEPTLKGLEEFLVLSEQDFGARVKQFFEETLNRVLSGS
jgi:hypothetical protein